MKIYCSLTETSTIKGLARKGGFGVEHFEERVCCFDSKCKYRYSICIHSTIRYQDGWEPQRTKATERFDSLKQSPEKALPKQ